MALVLLVHENLGKDKHVESLFFPRLDEGSIPSSSTVTANELVDSIRQARFAFHLHLMFWQEISGFGGELTLFLKKQSNK